MNLEVILSEDTASENTGGQWLGSNMSLNATTASTPGLVGIIDTGIASAHYIGVESSQANNSQFIWQGAETVRESMEVINSQETPLQIVEHGGEILQAELTIPMIQNTLRTEIMQRLLLLHKLDSLQSTESQALDLSNSGDGQDQVNEGSLQRQIRSSETPIQHQPPEFQEKRRAVFRCDQCGKTFSKNWGLTIHKRIHADVKPFKCTLCNYSGVQKIHLLQHYRTHTNERPYRCSICGSAYMSSTALNLHIRTKHTGRFSYACNHCAKAFDTPPQLKSHRKMCRKNSQPYSTIPKEYIPSWLKTNMDNGHSDQDRADL